MTYFVYILRCADNTYYTGTTNDLKKRLHAHNHLKSGAKYTRIRRPVELLYEEEHGSLSLARKREWEVKQLTRQEKENLFKNNRHS